MVLIKHVGSCALTLEKQAHLFILGPDTPGARPHDEQVHGSRLQGPAVDHDRSRPSASSSPSPLMCVTALRTEQERPLSISALFLFIYLFFFLQQDCSRMSSKELTVGQSSQYVGPYRLEKTLGKGQTGRSLELIPESGIMIQL